MYVVKRGDFESSIPVIFNEFFDLCSLWFLMSTHGNANNTVFENIVPKFFDDFWDMVFLLGDTINVLFRSVTS